MNENLFYFLNGFAGRSAFGDWLIYFCAEILPWLLVIGLIVYIFLAKDKISALRFVALSLFSTLFAWFLISFFKYNIHSPRPFEVLNIKPVFLTEAGDSMPSGHATFVGALAMAVYSQKKPFDGLRASTFGWFFILGALVVGLARIMAGVHWPVDIFVGFVAGGIIAWFLVYLSKKFLK